jgi:ankyrin repeat protein
MRVNGWPVYVLATALSLGASAKDFSKDLVTAVQKGDATKVGTLLAQGADPNSLDKKSGQPVLLLALAARTGDSSIAKALIAKGANVNVVPAKGSPALHLAVGNRNMEVIDILLGAGADPLLRSKDGDTPLELSKRGGCRNCYLALLKAQYRMHHMNTTAPPGR